jgi:hypothetical protein
LKLFKDDFKLVVYSMARKVENQSYDIRAESSITQRLIRAIESRDRAKGFGAGVAAGSRNARN